MWASKTWDGWIGIRYDRWLNLVHSAAQPSVRAPSPMTVSLLWGKAVGGCAQCSCIDRGQEKTLNELATLAEQVNVNTVFHKGASQKFFTATYFPKRNVTWLELYLLSPYSVDIYRIGTKVSQVKLDAQIYVKTTYFLSGADQRVFRALCGLKDDREAVV